MPELSPTDSLTSSRTQSIIVGLTQLQTRSKARANFIRHLSEREDISTDSKLSLRALLESEVQHRRSLRNVTRLWRTLGTEEQPSSSLLELTSSLLRENDTLGTALEPWRNSSLLDEQTRISEMWRSLSKSADSFIED